jgi:DNA repair protein RadC
MLREMAEDERPREKLKLRGSTALSDGELLAIILNTGSVGETVTDLSQRLLAQYGGLRGLFRLDLSELARIHGVGDAKSVRLKAALELGRRLAALSPDDRPQVGSPDDIANLLAIEMAALEQEELRVVLLDTKHRIVRTATVYRGSVNQAQVRVAEAFRDAVRQQATAIVAVHNSLGRAHAVSSRCGPHCRDRGGRTSARDRAARSPHHRSGLLALLETPRARLPHGVAQRGGTQDPDVA